MRLFLKGMAGGLAFAAPSSIDSRAHATVPGTSSGDVPAKGFTFLVDAQQDLRERLADLRVRIALNEPCVRPVAHDGSPLPLSQELTAANASQESAMRATAGTTPG